MASETKRGNKGHFHGPSLSMLLQYLPSYLAKAQNKKAEFWADFMPVWDESYPALDDDERQELEEEEESYKTEFDDVKARNEREERNKGCRNTVLQPLPLPGPHLQELRARGAGQAKLKCWFSNAKTKENTHKVELFCAWLSSLTALHGAPRHIKLVWILWRDTKHGEALRLLYRQKYKQDPDEEEQADGVDGFEKDDEDEGEGEGEGEGGDKEGEGKGGRTKLMIAKYKLALSYFNGLEAGGRRGERGGLLASTGGIREDAEGRDCRQRG
ncbi:hypothetical protein K438DRAFT_1988316 [Mycena galopus ATCC 62051]|nr:hypothetical protein K438DRAFT_1988316 [Mycena galopus ATCC 62051]